jgi:hypothetical protein
MDDVTQIVKLVTALLILVNTMATILSRTDGPHGRDDEEKGR